MQKYNQGSLDLCIFSLEASYVECIFRVKSAGDNMIIIRDCGGSDIWHVMEANSYFLDCQKMQE